MYEELVLTNNSSNNRNNNIINNHKTRDKITYISHNNVLNCLFILTDDNKLIIYDCNTGTKLREIDWLELNNYQSMISKLLQLLALVDFSGHIALRNLKKKES
jgi:hypothetical protein